MLSSDQVSDEIVGFHCQQAAEKILKALLSDLGVRFRKTHEIGALMALLAQAGHALPDQFENLDALTPFGAIYRTRITMQSFPSTGTQPVPQCASSSALLWKLNSGNGSTSSTPPAAWVPASRIGLRGE